MNVEELYDIYNTLKDAGDKISEHSKEYEKVIKATRLGPKEKKLSTDIIKTFFSSFPAQQSKALSAIFDLCEDEDKNIRIGAMKALPSFCNDTLSHLVKITEVMGQMLGVDDPTEQTCATNAFYEVLKKDPVSVINNVFLIIQSPDLLPIARYRCFQFILTKVKQLDSSIMTTEVQDLMITNIKVALNNCIADEFVLLISYLVSTNLVKSFVGQQEITQIILQQIEIDKDFKPYQANGKAHFTNRLVTCVKFILPFFSAKNESTQLVKYYCDKVLDQWEAIGALNNGIQYQTGIAQQLAIMAPFCGSLENPTKQVETIFNVLQLYMPQPPENTSSNEMPEFNFSIVESLLCAFHALARQCPEFLTEDPARLKDFRARLLYFSRGIQGCKKVLSLNATDKVFNAEEKRIREMCPQLLTNIQTLVKDLFYTPPVYKCKITLSFTKKEEASAKAAAEQKPVVEAVAAVGNKRHVPITFENSSNGASHQNAKRGGFTGDKKIYTPPSGKFSQNFQRGRGGGWYRGGRGRGGYRGGYRN